MKILISKFRSIGDVILLSPLITNLKSNYPEAKVDLIINKGTEALVKHNPLVNNIILHDRAKLKSLPVLKRIKEEFNTLKLIRKTKYDIVISTDRGDRGAQIAYFSKANIKIGRPGGKSFFSHRAFTDYFSFHGERHVIDLNLDPIKILGKEIYTKGLNVHWSREDSEVANNYTHGLGGFIHIHPVSQCMYKCIDDKLMAKIIDYCELELGIKVIITAAPVKQELDRVKKILSYAHSMPLNLSGKITLLETAAINKLSLMLLVVDTAVMHIATANDIPTLAFFGPTAVNNWGPWDKTKIKSDYIRGGGLQIHGKHRVLMEDKSCLPCSNLGCDNSGISNCLNSLSLDVIKEQIRLVVNGKKN